MGSLCASGTNAGTQQFQGQLQWLASWSYALSTDEVAAEYAAMSGYIGYFGESVPGGGGVFHADDTGVPEIPGDGGTNNGWSGSAPEVTLTSNTLPTSISTTNYAAYNEFYLVITNDSTNAYISVMNTLSNITYIVQTNKNLANGNGWQTWETLKASGAVTPARPVNLSSTAPLFYRAALVWSTCTNFSPVLPDWWAQQFFNSTACVDPNANPAGDGIDNWDKYLQGLNPNIAYISPLIVLPPGGAYVSVPAITIFSLSGATVKYTTDGSIPSATHGMPISSGMPLPNLPTASFTLEAWESGLPPNVVTSNSYTIIPGTPVFSIPSGVYTNGTTLQISCAPTNAIVRYTTNGIDPTTSSVQNLPTTIITLTTNQTIKATAWFNDLAGPVAIAYYIIQYPPSNDNFSNATALSGPSGEVQGTLVDSSLEQFEMTNATFQSTGETWYAAGSVWYKWTAPSNGNVVFNMPESDGVFYFPTLPDSNPNDLVPVTLNADGSFSATNNVIYYTREIYDWWETPGTFLVNWFYTNSIAPMFTPPPGSYYAGQPVVLSCPDLSAQIYYTLDGSSPLNGSEPAANASTISPGGSVTLYQTTTLKAVSWYSSVGMITSGLYTISGNTNPTATASAPILSPGNTNFASSLIVTLTCTNPSSIIFYTPDGSVPSRASASVLSGGTVALTNSTLFQAAAWAENMNLSPITTGWYAKNGVDSTGDGILDNVALLIGTDPFVSDADAVNPNPFAHGLSNMQVAQDPSMLLADNYSTLNDGVPDWWLVKCGYSATTPATALGANGQTLLTSFLAGLNPNNVNSQAGQTPPIDFHMVHGPSNSMVMVLDTVRAGIASYRLTSVNTDAGLPGVIEEFPPVQSMDKPGQTLGRYFQLTNQLAPGLWLFTMQAVDSNQLWSTTSSNTFGRYSITGIGIGFPDCGANGWQCFVGTRCLLLDTPTTMPLKIHC